MKVRMVEGISGGRGDGSAWPPPGGVLEVDDEEGAALCRARLAVPVAEPDGPVETPGVPMADVEARGAVSPAEAPEAAGDSKAGASAPKAASKPRAASQG